MICYASVFSVDSLVLALELFHLDLTSIEVEIR